MCVLRLEVRVLGVNGGMAEWCKLQKVKELLSWMREKLMMKFQKKCTMKYIGRKWGILKVAYVRSKEKLASCLIRGKMGIYKRIASCSETKCKSLSNRVFID